MKNSDDIKLGRIYKRKTTSKDLREYKGDEYHIIPIVLETPYANKHRKRYNIYIIEDDTAHDTLSAEYIMDNFDLVDEFV